ncbi:MAG: hypothetical protein H6741_00785 [Alphaproteobacteria bacterium]|nr:hypothetical protein [Alphaproteobacteria bacterium]MCB9791237.1 hypothetical protein [Alphaproteobacteria bacterium]
MLVTLLLLACKAEPADSALDSAPPDVTHPRDAALSVADLQAVGTHNSYHVETLSHPAWQYTHRPLDEQLGAVGVRQFELDMYWSEDLDDWEVYHVPLVDQGSTCATLGECACAMWVFSQDNPGHHPILTLLELKTDPPEDPEAVAQQLRALEEDILACWPERRVLTPDEVQGEAESLREAVEQGWPSFATTRGRSMWLLHTGSAWRLTYTDDDSSLAGRLLFPDIGPLDHPMAAIHTFNDPWDPAIPEAVALNHLVRTRADVDGEGPSAGDTTQRDQALASGAHFISTDFPEPHPETGYVVQMPGGTPSRCNPLRALEACAATDIEDPALLQGR